MKKPVGTVQKGGLGWFRERRPGERGFCLEQQRSVENDLLGGEKSDWDGRTKKEPLSSKMKRKWRERMLYLLTAS